MTIGLTIPGVETLHPRESWEPYCQPYTVASQNPPSQHPGNITQPVAHYTGADDLIDGDPGESADDLNAFIAAIQRNYATRRGYSVGYLFAIDWLGGVWEQRGFDYKSAANADHNEYTCPILMLVDGADPVTPEAAASGRAVWREFCRRSGRLDFVDRPLGHGELRETTGTGTATPCPGAGILNQLHAGVLDIDQEDDMTPVWFRVQNRPGVWVSTDGITAIYVDQDLYAAHGRPAAQTISANDSKKFAFVNTVNRGLLT